MYKSRKSSMGAHMDESEYTRLADTVMGRIESALDASEAGIDYEVAPGGVLEIECGDGSRIVVNRQAAAQEIWVAARSGGFHYRWDGSHWRDTRTGEDLYAALTRLLREQGCGEVAFD